ncbi:hypothetical protein QYM36_013594 [Artemia franciscana]|uniref:Uncharacterized protein n=1 Tax=Artemia franciscana TaxID=6661 RepID=A0AA88HQG0_ARTSF|nr:hypothetical protein QYM36_013594 [Artemia franciscana]
MKSMKQKIAPETDKKMRKANVLSPNPFSGQSLSPWGTPRLVANEQSGSSSALEGINELTPSMAVDLILSTKRAQKKQNEKNPPKKTEETQKRTMRLPTFQKPTEGIQKQGRYQQQKEPSVKHLKEAATETTK